jgi:hypothetical protein
MTALLITGRHLGRATIPGRRKCGVSHNTFVAGSNGPYDGWRYRRHIQGWGVLPPANHPLPLGIEQSNFKPLKIAKKFSRLPFFVD